MQLMLSVIMPATKKINSTSSSEKKRGRTEEEVILKAMEEIYLDKNDDGQYSLDGLIDSANFRRKPILTTVRQKLKEKYGCRLIFSMVHKIKTLICVCDTSERF